MKTIAFFLLLLAFQISVAASTCTVCDADDINNKIAAASDGDVINIPSAGGPYTWSKAVTITADKAVTLKGDTDSNGSPLTVIKDGRGQFAKLMVILARSGGAATNKVSRVTGLRFTAGGGTAGAGAYAFNLCGSGGCGLNNGVSNQLTDGRVRWDHCVVEQGVSLPDTLIETAIGVIDHVTFPFRHHFYPWNTNWVYTLPSGPTYRTNSDGAFAAPLDWGNWLAWFYIEDCTFVDGGGGSLYSIMDIYNGGRLVFRRNTIYKNCALLSHGTESGSGRNRSFVGLDVYDNTWRGDDINGQPAAGHNGEAVDMRGGVLRFHDNKFNNGFKFDSTGKPMIRQHTYRHWFVATNIGEPTGTANGVNPADKNDLTTGPTPYPHTDGVYFSGTAAGANSGNSVTVNGSPGWSTNQWRGYTIARTSGTSPGMKATIITGNGANNLNYHVGFNGINLNFASGDSLEIRRITQLIDQTGVAGGTATGSILRFGGESDPHLAVNDQVVYRNYAWNNKKDTTTPVDATFSIDDQETQNLAGIGVNGTPPPGEGYTTRAYPHPLVGGASIDSTSGSMTKDNPSTQTLTVVTSGFSGTPTFDAPTVTSVPPGATAGQLPTDVTFNTTAGTFNGHAAGAVAGAYTMTLTARYTPPTPDEVATGQYNLNIITPDNPPTVSLTSPGNGSTFTLNQTVTISANATDDSAISKVEFYVGGTTLLNTDTSFPYTFDWNTSSSVPLTTGTKVLTAKAYDNHSPTPQNTTSASVTITVTSPSPTPSGPTPARIIIRP